MRVKSLGIAVLTLSLALTFASSADAGRRVRTFGDKPEKAAQAKKKPSKNGDKPFDELVKDKVKIEGLFTFYHDTTDNSMLMAITPEQFGPVYLCSETRSAAEGAFFDNGAMGRSFPFFFKQVGKTVMLMEKNLRLQADTTSTLRKAVEHGISDHLYEATEVKSKPHDSSGAILVDPADLFIRDAQNLSYFLGQAAKMGVRFDKKNSYFYEVKSFPHNTEIDVKLHYATSKPLSAATMQNPYSLFHTYHYSLSTLPETDYVPRIADDRIGHFLTMHMDYTDLDSYSPYVRYVNRWHLKKKNPDARISEPVEPIVFWVENTVPPEYRDAVAEGIEFWNMAFEKIGFRNAIVAKQMPDTATWDPADVRYNTVRWFVMPGATYAVGPSHANPYTGQIYDADIRVSADFLRAMFNTMEYYIKPVAYDGSIPEEDDPLSELREFEQQHQGHFCNYQAEKAQDAAFGLSYLMAAAGDFVDKDSLTREYVHAYLVELVAHEIGHTLGLRHNFKASSIYSLEQINDRDFTREHALTGSIMEYAPVNIAPTGEPQGEFYSSVPGPYDYWVIEYAYSDFGASSPEEEFAELDKIASRAAEPRLVYASDEDAFGYSAKAIDPLVNLFDLSDDPLAYVEQRVRLTRELWENSLNEFEEDGQGYQNVLRAFTNGWRAYRDAARLSTRYLGGIHHNRYHVGDAPPGVLPFNPVSAEAQRRAMSFLQKYVFASDAFELPAEVHNKLQPERFSDFTGSSWRMPQIDYPFHARVLSIQNNALGYAYNPLVLGRLVNNTERYAPGEEAYTMYDLFTDMRGAIWTELDATQDINSFRRQLQLLHLKRLTQIYLMDSPVFPSDARTLAANDLDAIQGSAQKSLQSGSVDNMTRAHLKEVLRQIESAKGARRNYIGG